jgi:hypothetical protein
MFTLVNITPNWIFSHFGFTASPVNSGNHWTNPHMTANTAPIDNT